MKAERKVLESERDIARIETRIATLQGELAVEEMRPDAELGIAFRTGPKKPRQDALARLMERTYDALSEENGRPPTDKDLWAALPDHDSAEILCYDQNDPDAILWTCNGRGRKTSWKSFQNRLTRLRKKKSPLVD